MKVMGGDFDPNFRDDDEVLGGGFVGDAVLKEGLSGAKAESGTSGVGGTGGAEVGWGLVQDSLNRASKSADILSSKTGSFGTDLEVKPVSAAVSEDGLSGFSGKDAPGFAYVGAQMGKEVAAPKAKQGPMFPKEDVEPVYERDKANEVLKVQEEFGKFTDVAPMVFHKEYDKRMDRGALARNTARFWDLTSGYGKGLSPVERFKGIAHITRVIMCASDPELEAQKILEPVVERLRSHDPSRGQVLRARDDGDAGVVRFLANDGVYDEVFAPRAREEDKSLVSRSNRKNLKIEMPNFEEEGLRQAWKLIENEFEALTPYQREVTAFIVPPPFAEHDHSGKYDEDLYVQAICNVMYGRETDPRKIEKLAEKISGQNSTHNWWVDLQENTIEGAKVFWPPILIIRKRVDVSQDTQVSEKIVIHANSDNNKKARNYKDVIKYDNQFKEALVNKSGPWAAELSLGLLGGIYGKFATFAVGAMQGLRAAGESISSGLEQGKDIDEVRKTAIPRAGLTFLNSTFPWDKAIKKVFPETGDLLSEAAGMALSNLTQEVIDLIGESKTEDEGEAVPLIMGVDTELMLNVWWAFIRYGGAIYLQDAIAFKYAPLTSSIDRRMSQGEVKRVADGLNARFKDSRVVVNTKDLVTIFGLDAAKKAREFGYEGDFLRACMNGVYVDLKFGNILANMGFDKKTLEGCKLASSVIFNDNRFNIVGADEAAGDYMSGLLWELKGYRDFCVNYRTDGDIDKHTVKRLDEELELLDKAIELLERNLSSDMGK